MSTTRKTAAADVEKPDPKQGLATILANAWPMPERDVNFSNGWKFHLLAVDDLELRRIALANTGEPDSMRATSRDLAIACTASVTLPDGTTHESPEVIRDIVLSMTTGPLGVLMTAADGLCGDTGELDFSEPQSEPTPA